MIVEWARDFLDEVFESWLLVEIDRSDANDVRVVGVSGVGPRWQGVEIAVSD